jgi:hypothetical protein
MDGSEEESKTNYDSFTRSTFPYYTNLIEEIEANTESWRVEVTMNNFLSN